MRKLANPRRLWSSTAFWRFSTTSSSASSKGFEKMERLPEANSRRRSATMTSGRRAVPGRSGISTRVQRAPPNVPASHRASASADGVADPSTRAQPWSRANLAATSRAW